MHDVDLAIYRTVHDHGGADRLSKYLACRPGTLNNKADPACEGHQLNYREGIALQLATNSRRIIKAEAAELGGVYIQLRNWQGVSDEALLDAWARLQEEHGQTAAALRKSLNDHVITREELRHIKREMYEDFAAAFELLHRVEGLCDDTAEEL